MSRLALMLVFGGVAVPRLPAQATLDEAAERARAAWLAQDAGALAASGDTLVLRLGRGGEVVVERGQAARLLGEYFRPAAERTFEIRSVKATGGDRGYVDASRRYVIRGTADELTETVLLGFRRAGGRWRLQEIRVAP
ncbi:MAG: hypothetical protein HY560_08255 [Gemmatimonadetes bacterium]|nr:hypothetical protein [Gemmatimonadota bacterium]